jgi:hypothetical protein
VRERTRKKRRRKFDKLEMHFFEGVIMHKKGEEE